MKHDTAIPAALHSGARPDVKDALGAFWSSIFRDQGLVDAELSARVLSACQTYIDAMEALSLRDHTGMPVFHREHWHPLLVRLSERNTGCGLKVGMEGDPKIGPQPYELGDWVCTGCPDAVEVRSVSLTPRGDGEWVAELSIVYHAPSGSVFSGAYGTCTGTERECAGLLSGPWAQEDPDAYEHFSFARTADMSSSAFMPDEVFVVGGNAEFSRVNTYPIDPAVRDALVGVSTCMCDSVSSPKHILIQGRDFALRDGVLVIRKEHDPFDAGGYMVVEDGDDRVAVMWMCDAAFDREHVGDFLAYPLGFDVPSTPGTARMLSALWDIVVYGLTPKYLNIALGALYGVPVVPGDTVVEEVGQVGGDAVVVTPDTVYRLEASRLAADRVAAGLRLAAGDFLTDEVRVHHGLSMSEVDSLIADGILTTLTLPPGSIAGIDEPVVVSNMNSPLRTGPSGQREWFELNVDDDIDSPFWTAMFARTTAEQRILMCQAMAGGGSAVNPLRAFGYTLLSNTVLIHTTRPLVDEPCAGQVLAALVDLMPETGSVLLVQTLPEASASAVRALSAPGPAPDTVAMADDVSYETPSVSGADSTMGGASDEVYFRLIPDMEV